MIAALAAAAIAFLLSGCSSRPETPADLPPPVESTSVGVGDVFELRVVGEEKLPTSFTVAADGTVDLPYIKRVEVLGLEPQQIAEVVRTKLIETQIRSDPSVSVSVKEYNSKRINVLGEVQKPGSFPLEPGMTLVRAISLAGGFNSIANRDRVTVQRRLRGGKTKTVTVSVGAIIDGTVPDIPLQSGDAINVSQRIF